jgi:hypothetical protein
MSARSGSTAAVFDNGQNGGRLRQRAERQGARTRRFVELSSRMRPTGRRAPSSACPPGRRRHSRRSVGCPRTGPGTLLALRDRAPGETQTWPRRQIDPRRRARSEHDQTGSNRLTNYSSVFASNLRPTSIRRQLASSRSRQNSSRLKPLASYSATSCAASARLRRRSVDPTCSSLIPSLQYQRFLLIR